jgi:hypothetical protein
MNRDELREKIAGIISEDIRSDCSSGQIADDILDILAPILEKARKWRKVMEVYHADTEERFVQFANTMSKVRELEGEGGVSEYNQKT